MELKKNIRKIAGRIVGTHKLQYQLDTLFYFLNAYADMKDFPKPEGPLAMLHKGDALLLQIVDAVCKKHDLPYWLDAGTCLGAIRHQGFIPWDDDVDLCMLREDYERAVSILKEELGKYGIDAKESCRDAGARIGIGYKHKQTGIWIDLRPFECIQKDLTEESARNALVRRIKRYRWVYNRVREGLPRESVFKLQRIFVGRFCGKEDATTLVRSMEFDWRVRIWHHKDIFPLQKAMFEGFEVPVPNNIDAFLTQFFGNEYMSFPREGPEHHGDGKGKLRTWAEKSGTDMAQIILELQNILNDISEGQKTESDALINA